MSTHGQRTQFGAKARQLENLLEKQIQLVRRGDIRSLESMTRQVAGLVEEIAADGTLSRAELEQKRGRLARLYGELCILLRVQMAKVQADVSRIRKGLKALRTYRNSV